MVFTETEQSVEPSVEIKSGTEILEYFGLKENDLWGRRVVIIGESSELRTLLETSDHSIDFEFVASIDADNQAENAAGSLQDNSADFIIDLGRDSEPGRERYSIEDYRKMIKALHHHGKILVSDPLENRAFPIASRLARNFTIFFDPKKREVMSGLLRVENIIFTAADKRIGRTSLEELWSEEFWWEIIDELLSSDPPQLSKHDVAEEFAENLRSRLREDFEYKTVGRPIPLTSEDGKPPIRAAKAPEIEKVLYIEKLDERLNAAEEAMKYLSDTFGLKDLSVSEIYQIRRIADETIKTRRREFEFYSKGEGKESKRDHTMYDNYWEISARFLSEVYGVDFGNRDTNIIGSKTAEGMTVAGSKRVIQKYRAGKLVDSREFDAFTYPSTEAMRRAIKEYENQPVAGIDEPIETETQMVVSDILKKYIQSKRKDIFAERLAIRDTD